jgi:hypothetical protein
MRRTVYARFGPVFHSLGRKTVPKKGVDMFKAPDFLQKEGLQQSMRTESRHLGGMKGARNKTTMG